MRPLEPGDPRTIGPYRTLARIGAGGMATVYLARSRGGRAVAVKSMHAEYAREPEARERFRREVAAASAAGGVHSPSVLDADPEAAVPWMATEFLPSVSLREAVRRYGPMPGWAVRRLGAGLAEALAGLHRTGIVHLDVTPGNVLLTAEGPRLIDFGIAAGAGVTSPAGSWGFMSPEQVAGRAGPPSDVHSLGSTLEYARGGTAAGPGGGDDALLRDLIADCRRPDPLARPTAEDVLRRLAPAGRGGGDTEDTGDAASWLPTGVVGAIAASASAADHPPLPVPGPGPRPHPPRRRLLLFGAAAVVAAGGGTAAALALLGDGSSSAAAGPHATAKRPGTVSANTVTTAPPTPPTPTLTPTTPASSTLDLSITGDGPLTDLSYALNGTWTRLKHVSLPFHRTLHLPRPDGTGEWRLRLTIASGRIRCRVRADGTLTYDQRLPDPRVPGPVFYPNGLDTGGSVSGSGAFPTVAS